MRPSKPTPNSIWGTEQLPKFPIPDEDATAALVAAAEAAAVVAAEEEAATPEPVPAITLPWSSTDAIAAKSVLIPKTPLNASACPPVLAVTADAAA